MKTPAEALLWELWRKNRWGFCVILLLLGVCALLACESKRLHDQAQQLKASDPNQVSFAAEQFLIKAASGWFPQSIQIKQGREVLFTTAVQPGQVLRLEASFESAPTLRASLQSAGDLEQTLFSGPLKSRRQLSWSTADGRTGVLPFAFDPEFPGRLALAQLAAEQWRQEGLGWSVVLLAFSGLALLGMFGLAEPHRFRGFTGMPPRRFTLPIATGLMVICPVLAGTLAATFISILWSWIVHWSLLPAAESLSGLYVATLLSAGLVWFQAVVWSLPAWPRLRVTFICFLVLAQITLAALPYASTTALDQLWEHWQGPLTLLFGFGWIAGAAAAWIGVKLERHGAWASVPGFPSWAVSVLNTPLIGAAPFRSPLAAQFWIEWRRNGRLALAILGPLVCLTLVAAVWAHVASLEVQWVPECFAGLGLGLSVAWIAIAGLNLARDPVSKQLVLSSFTAVRPVSSGTLVRAKILVALVVWVGGVAAASLGWALAATAGAVPDYGEILPPGLAIAVVLLSLHLIFGILPLCLTGRLPGFPWSLLPLLLVYGGAIQLLHWTHLPRFEQAVFVLLILIVLVKLLVAFWAFRQALVMKLNAPGWVIGYAGLWLIVALLLGRWALMQYVAGVEESALVFPALLAALPLARISLSPLAMAINRHR